MTDDHKTHGRSVNSIHHLLCSMHTACIHVVQRSAVSADPAIRLIVETPPVSVRTVFLVWHAVLVELAGRLRLYKTCHDGRVLSNLGESAPKLKKIWVIFTKLWVAVARHTFKWVKMKITSFYNIIILTGWGLRSPFLTITYIFNIISSTRCRVVLLMIGGMLIIDGGSLK